MGVPKSTIFQKVCSFDSNQVVQAALKRTFLVSHGIHPAKKLLLNVNLSLKLLANNPIINIAEHLEICELF